MTAHRLVFCRDCKHFRSGFSDHWYEHCAVERQKPTKRTATYYRPDQPLDPLTPAEKNAKNDCPDFKAVPR